ncbi:prolyl oligopeptidase family serine peptidase [Salipaludibacillus sp. HK11]|uniref:prolyl oligopeptidase family serine peptidase n=1 Tax=Salipaludibacillus sp. HK11 TaxID=3394320 RepID=UPI0039FC2476
MLSKLRKLTALLLIVVLAFSMVLPQTTNVVQAEEIEFSPDTYQKIIEVDDWGPSITKLIVNLGEKVSEEEVTKDLYDVFVSRSDSRLEEPLLEEGYRKVTNAYISDRAGNPVNGISNFIVLELEIGPTISLGSAMNIDVHTLKNAWTENDYTITQVTDSGLVIDQSSGEIRELVDEFSTGEATYDGVRLTYADYVPAGDDDKTPLIIWLHGMAEGGTDPTVTLGANKATNFITDEVQDFYDGAYVLSVQTPTFWMDGFASIGDGTSIYEDALMALIKDYVADNPDIDPTRIYIGGLSNGGYMTMLMLRDYPDYFAAAIAVAESLEDELISDEDINNIAKTPLWFVHAANDSIVDPETTVLPTYERLVDAGADVHLTYYDDVHDLSGLYTNEDGSPYQYPGHSSWIHLYNNDPSTVIDGEEISVLEWVSTKENPDTATSIFNILILGMLLLVGGTIVFVIMHKRKINT